MSEDLMLTIDGAGVAGDNPLDVINPATGKPFTTVGAASEAQAERAVAAAKAAAQAWGKTSIETRRALVLRIADAIEANTDRIARTLVMEQGKPWGEAVGEVGDAAGFLRYYATVDLPVQVIQDDDAFRIEQHHRPLGVVVGIAAWNFPLYLGCTKLAPALIAGNAFIWKPAPSTPLTAMIVGELARAILPQGVIGVIVDRNDLGGFLSGHPDVAKISFTGSTATGRKVMAAVAPTLKHLTLELGGNDAGIVLDDADPDTVVPGLAGIAFFNAGQVCTGLKRLYVHDSLYDTVCEKLAAAAQELAVGDGLDQGTKVGPLQNAMQYAKAREYLAAAHADGTVIAGGTAIEGDGYFVQPTIVRDIAEGSPLVDEEQFAPILPVIRYSEIDDVVARANASPYGLGGSVWSSNPARAVEVASRLEAGSLWINHHGRVAANVPFAGAKQSGHGVEFGVAGLAEFTQLYVISVPKAS